MSKEVSTLHFEHAQNHGYDLYHGHRAMLFNYLLSLSALQRAATFV